MQNMQYNMQNMQYNVQHTKLNIWNMQRNMQNIWRKICRILVSWWQGITNDMQNSAKVYILHIWHIYAEYAMYVTYDIIESRWRLWPLQCGHWASAIAPLTRSRRSWTCPQAALAVHGPGVLAPLHESEKAAIARFSNFVGELVTIKWAEAVVKNQGRHRIRAGVGFELAI